MLYYIISIILIIFIYLGVEATTQIRRFDPSTPIISMTSNITSQECLKYLSHGMTDILAKPLTKTNLFSMLEKYCMHLKALQPNLPNFHLPSNLTPNVPSNIPRQFDIQNRHNITNSIPSITSTSSLSSDTLNNNSNNNDGNNEINNNNNINNSNDNWITNQFPLLVSDQFSDDYLQMMNNFVNSSSNTSTSSHGIIRIAKDNELDRDRVTKRARRTLVD